MLRHPAIDRPSKLAGSRTEVLPIGQRPEDGAGSINTREGDGVTTPIDLNTLLLQDEEGEQCTDSDGTGEGSGGDAGRKFISMNLAVGHCGRRSLVVFGPPAQETPPDVEVKGEGDGNGGPNVGHVVRSPDESTVQEDGNVEVGKNLELLAKEVEGDGQNRAEKEAPQEAIVDSTRTEHLLRAKSTPKDGSGEESVVSGADEVVLLLGRADAWNSSHLVVEDGRGDEGRD